VGGFDLIRRLAEKRGVLLFLPGCSAAFCFVASSNCNSRKHAGTKKKYSSEKPSEKNIGRVCIDVIVFFFHSQVQIRHMLRFIIILHV